MTRIPRNLLTLLSIALLTLTSAIAPAQTAAPLAHGISIANMDTAVRPGDDFYLYANGGFLARTKLPADRASIGVFSTLADLSFKQTASIIEDAAKANAAPGTNERKIADLYHSYMDEAAIESHGLAALKPHLDAIAAIHTDRKSTRLNSSHPSIS